MVGAFISFLVLFGLIKLFERGRDDLDGAAITMAAIVPILIAVLIRVALEFLYPEPILTLTLPPLALIGSLFFLLYKNLEVPLGRSVGYTVGIVLLNEGLAFFLTAG